MEVYIIVNEHAGNGRGHKIWSQLQSNLKFSFTVYKTDYPKHAIEIVKEIASKCKSSCLVIGIGGDGTLSEITAGAVGHNHIVVSSVKAGSGNDFANGYHVFKSAKELNQYVKDEQLVSQTMNLGEVKTDSLQSSFVNNTGFGFDALVAITVNQSNIKKVLNKVGIGRLAYVLLTIKLLLSFKKFAVKAEIDGNTYSFKDVWFVAICNQPFFGGGMKISPRSKMNDNIFEFVIVQDLSPIKLLLLFLSVFSGKHEKLKEITFIKTSSVKMTFDAVVVSHVDGDLFSRIEANQTVSIDVAEQKWNIAK